MQPGEQHTGIHPQHNAQGGTTAIEQAKRKARAHTAQGVVHMAPAHTAGGTLPGAIENAAALPHGAGRTRYHPAHLHAGPVVFKMKKRNQ